MELDFETCYRAGSARDARFDGMFVTAVTSTGIYCRPSCPAVTPVRANVRYFPTAAAAQAAGFRACKRCRPDASPGSPEWNVRADLVARAMRLIADGAVDREGVAGLARRLHVGERHLHRVLVAEVGAGPQVLARAHRAQTARILIETTALPFSDIAFAAGFGSIRAFNATMVAVFAETPGALRARGRGVIATPGAVTLSLPYRVPLAADALFGFLAARAVPGIESAGDTYGRSLRLPHGDAVVALRPEGERVVCTLRLGDLRDLTAAVQRCRRLLDLDADPTAIDAVLEHDARLRPLVARRPGIRVPGTVDGAELAMRAVIGQQISVAAARTLGARLVARCGKPLTASDGALTHLWPEPDAVVDADLGGLGMPAARVATLRALAGALAAGDLAIDPGADRDETHAHLLSLPGVGAWTAAYIAMRALGDPDAFLPTDLGVRRALARLGYRGEPEPAAARWRPWRAYAQQHLWAVV